MCAKLHKTKEKKFTDSLDHWGSDTDNRPMIRLSINKAKDKFDYRMKDIRIREEKLAVAKITGDPLSNINLFDAGGNCYSRIGNIRDYNQK